MEPRSLRARLPVGTLATRAVGWVDAATAALAGTPPATVDAEAVTVAYTSERWFRWEGQPGIGFAPLSGFFRTRDGWVRTHANYPHHERALRRALGLLDAPQDGDDPDRVGARLRALPTREAVEIITREGGLCVEVRREDPETDERLRASPLATVRRMADSPLEATVADASAPLRGVRVLDLTRVIAGPVATRTLALLGADVLRVDSPRIPEIAVQHLDTGHGKRSTLLDLDADADRRRFDGLLVTADIVVLGYRPAALSRLGLEPRALCARHPGMIVARLGAWGAAGGRGFDSLVQAASGIAWIESADGRTPGALPAQALDHTAGYALAAAVLTALRRRGEVGGSWLVETSLRRVAAELLGMPRDAGGDLAEPVDPDRFLQHFTVGGHDVVTAGPAVAYAGAPTGFRPPQPWGSSAPVWLPR